MTLDCARTCLTLFETISNSEEGVLDECVVEVAQTIVQKYRSLHTVLPRKLPEIQDVIQIAATNLMTRGLSVENLLIHAKAISMAWQSINWINSKEYQTQEHEEMLLSELYNAIRTDGMLIFCSEVESDIYRLRSYRGATQVVLLERMDDVILFEVYPRVFQRYAILTQIEGDNAYYTIPEETTTIRVLSRNGSIATFALIYNDRETGFSKEYVYTVPRNQQQVKCSVTSLEDLRRELSQRKKDSDSIMKYLTNNGVSCLYHFTDARNIESIKKMGGLFSWDYLEGHGIKIHNPGGNEFSRNLDMSKGTQDYVRLSFSKLNPMFHRKITENPSAKYIWLEVDPVVASYEYTLFSDRNATDKHCLLGREISDLKRINLEATRAKYVKHFNPDNTENEVFKQKQAEVLCRTFIPLELILNLD